MTGNAIGSVSITLDGTTQTLKLPLLPGTIGPSVFDIRKLYPDLGLFTYDPGYGGTAACESKITFIDGDEGILLLPRAFRSSSWPNTATFVEVAATSCSMANCPPRRRTRRVRLYACSRHTMVHEQMRAASSRGSAATRIRWPSSVALRRRIVGLLSRFRLDINNDPTTSRMIASIRLIAKVPTIAAWAYKYSIGQPFMYPRNDLGYAENFLYMMNAVPAEPYHVNPVLARAMDRILILHADHEQNASTSTVRLAGSTGANPFACVAAGIASLWGPAHGGANEAVLKMLAEIGSKEAIPGFIEKVKDKNSNVPPNGLRPPRL